MMENMKDILHLLCFPLRLLKNGIIYLLKPTCAMKTRKMKIKMIILCIIIASFWIVTCFLDFVFKSCMFFPYIRTLEFSGIIIKPFTIVWYITCMNRPLQKLGHWKPKFARKWFEVGTYITCLVTFPVLCLLTYAVYNMTFSGNPNSDQLLKPAVPGVNLPLGQVFYYLLTLLICSVFHELGHAIAAAREGVRIQGWGFALCVIFPFAYVDLNDDQMQILSAWRQLNIYCAGVWHNIVLMVIAFSLLFMNPVLLTSAFNRGSGITVIDVKKESGLSGPAGLTQGSHITALNLCTVHDIHSWEFCISQISVNLQDGYCVSKKFILENSHVKDENKETGNCFEHSSNDSICFTYRHSQNVPTHVYLPVRKLLRLSKPCNHNFHCGDYEDGICVSPVFKSIDQRLIQIFRKHLDSVLYIGSPNELIYSITASSWTTKFDFFPAYIMHMYETLLQYVLSFSGALGILNLIPCPRFDGHWLYHSLIEFLLFPLVPERSQRAFIFLGFLGFGCCLISGIIIMSSYNLYMSFI